MPLVVLDDVCLAYGHHPLLDHACLGIDSGERVCLLGRNGAGKSSLLRLLNGEITPDSGEVRMRDGLRVACLRQDVPVDDARTVYEVVAAGLPRIGVLLAEYHRAAEAVAHGDEKMLDTLSTLQHELETHDGWSLQQRIENVLSRLELNADVTLGQLSGGYKRRVLLAQALVADPELLLLDEPTNHLDLEGIAWLEEFLRSYPCAVLFVSHDRAFVQRVATRIIELDRGRLTSWSCGYHEFLERKEHELAVEADHNAKFDKVLAQEEAWIRQGIKARRTRNEGRVRALKALRRERSERINVVGRVSMQVDQGARSGKLVAELQHVNVTYGGRPILKDVSVNVERGDRIGIIGPNGAGKTTLIRTILGDLVPDSGTVRLGTNLQIAYFDQQREQLNLNATVIDNLGLGTDFVMVNGRSRHVMSYLQDFLFAPERVRSPVSALSGGERNRLLLARLFARPANVLVLDEPTNDLDIETLELLEELLGDYTGTVLLVSHDREFLDNVVTSTLVFEGNGAVHEYVGGYQDWLRQRRSSAAVMVQAKSGTQAASKAVEAEKPRRKLGYKEQRELEALPVTIERLEGEQTQLQQEMTQPGFYQDNTRVQKVLARLAALEPELAAAYLRWEQLEG